ncbi:MAG: hypothetical protein K6F49_02565 [Saccharofermentans sp.]|nr:hypothetical protein [Saccharofermentans sp.]
MSDIEEKKEQYIDPAWDYKNGGYPVFVAVLGIACIFAIVVKLYPMAVVWAVLFILSLLSTLKARKIKKEVMTFRDKEHTHNQRTASFRHFFRNSYGSSNNHETLS